MNKLLGIIVILLALFVFQRTPSYLGGGSSVDTFNQMSVTTKNISTSTPLTVAPESAGRKFFSIQNNDNRPLFCLLEGSVTSGASVAKATGSQAFGFIVMASGSSGSYYENRGYIGNVNCISAATTSLSTSTVTIAQ